MLCERVMNRVIGEYTEGRSDTILSSKRGIGTRDTSVGDDRARSCSAGAKFKVASMRECVMNGSVAETMCSMILTEKLLTHFLEQVVSLGYY